MTHQDTVITTILRQSGALALPGNLPYRDGLPGSGVRMQRHATGHLVIYGPENRRILMTDPEGHPLHECEWGLTTDGQPKLIAARLRLEWGQWVGIRSEGLVHGTSLDLSTRPGWEALTRDDLRMMAARAMNVPFEHIQFFYTDEDLQVDRSGQATIRQRKDAFYILQDGRFDGAKFMSCMSTMHWERIDYLPVVELFLSLLPGTGSATFELIRGLYDDQNPRDPLPLRYRGIPVYPSEGAFHLFSQFFSPSVEGPRDPLSVFLDPAHSHEVIWLPCANPPLRYFDPSHHLCVTVRKGKVQKATRGDDPAGLSFFAPNSSGVAPYGRAVTVQETNLVLQDGVQHVELPTMPFWGISSSPDSIKPLTNFPTWHRLFPEGSPEIEPAQAFSTTLLYPIDDEEIGEKESQPFVMDYLDDLIDENPSIQTHMTSSKRVLVVQCDAAVSSCIRLDRPRSYTILYSWSQFARKHAQNVWSQLARAKHLDWIDRIRFLPYAQHCHASFRQPSDAVYVWIPFSYFHDPLISDQTLTSVERTLSPGGLAFISGPSLVHEQATRHHLDLLYADSVHNLQTFRLHQSILPRARLNQELTVFVYRKRVPGLQ